jgi:hypothetical protein
VYEIYKVGAEPHWLEGLDLLSIAGLCAAVVPHFNNAEGGNHDTRYCYMGERRLRILEEQLPDDVFVLGVDEHTALILDLGAGSATVAGLGGVTVRRRTGATRVESGQTMSIRCLADLAGHDPGATPPTAVRSGEPALARSPLLDELGRAEASFADAVAAREARSAVEAILGLDDLVVEWSRDTLQSDELDRGRAALRSMVVRLGEAAEGGLRDQREVVGPFVEALLDARQQARADNRWHDADAIRDRLLAAGVEVQDGPEGTHWQVR